MSSTTSQRPQVTLGEAIDPADFNNMSSWTFARLIDHLWGGSQIGLTGGSIPLNTQHCYCPAINSGFVSSPSNNHFATAATTILQYASGNLDGATQRLLMYRLDAGEIEAALTGDGAGGVTPTVASGVRYDIVAVKLTEVDGPLVLRPFEDAVGNLSSQNVITARQALASFAYVQGTSTAWGAVPAGYVALFGLKCFSAGAVFVYDWRMPMRKGFCAVGIEDMVGQWAVTGSPPNATVTTTTNTAVHYMPLKNIPPNGRLLRWVVRGSFPANVANMCVRNLKAAPPYAISLEPTELQSIASAGGLFFFGDYSGPPSTVSSSGSMPVWGNGNSNSANLNAPGSEGCGWQGTGDLYQRMVQILSQGTASQVIYGGAYEWAF